MTTTTTYGSLKPGDIVCHGPEFGYPRWWCPVLSATPMRGGNRGTDKLVEIVYRCGFRHTFDADKEVST